MGHFTDATECSGHPPAARPSPKGLIPPAGQPERSWSRLIHDWSGGRLFYLPEGVPSKPRWGHAEQPHAALVALLAQNAGEYSGLIDRALKNTGFFSEIPAEQSGARDPYWHNGWFPPTDAVALCQLLHDRDPGLLIEIGSGNSTKFARRAIDRWKLKTHLASIDPKPRAEIDALCDECHRSPLEECDLSIFDRLKAGDVLFIDSSHRALISSDVSVLFLDVLPRLPQGVLIHLHDIWLPFDYPERWRHWHFSEQYLLACMLLFGQGRYRVLFPSMYVSSHSDLRERLVPLWDAVKVSCPRHGGSFWLELISPVTGLQ